ncbi:hypothetical protein KI387_039218, partial [Taxus chinensis]
MGPQKKLEPDSLDALLRNAALSQVFHDFGWLDFIHQFEGFNEVILEEFLDNFESTCSQVGGRWVEITSQVISDLSGLPDFGLKVMTNAPLQSMIALFHEEGEAFPEVILTPLGIQKGVKQMILPDIWSEIAKWVNRYFICDGQDSVRGGDALKMIIHLKKGCVNQSLQ